MDLRMLENIEVSRLASGVAQGRAASAVVKRVLTEPATDSEGKDALRITMVVKPTYLKTLAGDEALDLLVAIQRKLSEAGEERLPIVEYATEADLEEDRVEKRDQEDEDLNESDA